jgi:hypothetical protein
MIVPVCSCLLIGTTCALAATPEAGARRELLDNALVGFSAWDSDDDGRLSVREIELAVADPKVKGTAAATAATLRRAIRSNHDLEWLTFDLVAERVERGASTPQLPDIVEIYAAACERIQTTRREMFVNELPDATKLSQGKLGDCFLLATLGTVAAADPQRLKQMLRPLPNDKYEATFGTGRKLVLDMPTDAEICIGARNQNDGMWAIAFEKAVGTIYLERQKSPRHVTPLAVIGVGGTPNVPLELLTGHVVKRSGCEDFQRGQLDEAARVARLDEIRQKLIANKQAKRLVVGGTAPKGKQTLVPGLYYNHSYGVLDYDAATDRVTFWNPFGNGYTPKGPPGLKHGFVTSHGRFSMTLPEAVMWFGSFSMETAEPTERFNE